VAPGLPPDTRRVVVQRDRLIAECGNHSISAAGTDQGSGDVFIAIQRTSKASEAKSITLDDLTLKRP
jgi:hypothetical protein